MRLWPREWTPSLGHPWPRGEELRGDVVAGISLTGLLVPAGMGYALVAGLPPVTGIYTTIVALIAYAAVGPSRVLIFGPDSALMPIIAAGLAPLAVSDPDGAVAAAGVMALMSGAFLVIAGRLRLGLVTDLLSRPIRIGLLNGVAVMLIVTQLPGLFGFEIGSDVPVPAFGEFVSGLADGQTNSWALLLGVVTLVGIVTLRKLVPSVPELLVAVVAVTVVVWIFGLGEDVPVVGALPGGIASPALGGFSLSDIPALVPAALGIALVGSAQTTVLSQAVSKTEDRVDANHEMAALGVSNIACGALGGFAVSASASRTPVALRSGSSSQVTALVGAGTVAFLAVAVPGATSLMPSCALAAIVIVAAGVLADPSSMWNLWRYRPLEFALATASFLGVVAVGVLPGIGIAVALSLVAFVARAWYPYRAELARVDGRNGYHDVDRHPEGRRIPGLVIARFDAPLFFANSRIFATFILDLVDSSPEPVKWVMVASEPMTDIDTTAAEDLVALDEWLEGAGVHLVFAAIKGPVKDRLAAYGLSDRFGEDRFFSTLGTAVKAYLRDTGTDWTDWTDDDVSEEGTEDPSDR